MTTTIQQQQQRQQPDAQAVEEFAGRALTDVAGTMATLFCIVGDRLGLFAALDVGPEHVGSAGRGLVAEC
jgi:hypothetical protein